MCVEFCGPLCSIPFALHSCFIVKSDGQRVLRLLDRLKLKTSHFIASVRDTNMYIHSPKVQGWGDPHTVGYLSIRRCALRRTITANTPHWGFVTSINTYSTSCIILYYSCAALWALGSFYPFKAVQKSMHCVSCPLSCTLQQKRNFRGCHITHKLFLVIATYYRHYHGVTLK